jgi:hypothetical protein
MSIDIFGLAMGDHVKEFCLLCGERNLIIIDNIHVDGWRCWSCMTKYWMDDISMSSYMIVHGRDEAEAELDLRTENPPIVILEGKFCE